MVEVMCGMVQAAAATRKAFIVQPILGTPFSILRRTAAALSTSAQPVESRDFTGRLPWAAASHRGDHRAEPDPFRGHRGGEQYSRIGHFALETLLLDHVIPDEKTVSNGFPASFTTSMEVSGAAKSPKFGTRIEYRMRPPCLRGTTKPGSPRSVALLVADVALPGLGALSSGQREAP